MVIIFKGDEAERLQHALGHLTRRGENFRHAVHQARLRLKSYFDEVALSQRMGHFEQAARHGNRLEFGFCAPAVLETNRSQDRVSELDPGRAPR